MAIVGVTEARGRGHLRAVRDAPPHDTEAEQALLGAMLLSRDAAVAAQAVVGARDFYRPANANVFQAVERVLLLTKGPPDAVSVDAELERMGLQLEDPAYLAQLQAETPSTANAVHYAEIVARHSARRRRLAAATEITQAIWDDDTGAEAKARLGLDDGPTAQALTIEDIGALMRSPEPAAQPEILRRTDGAALLVPGSVTLLHGEPSAGKSWLTTEAVRQCIAQGKTVVFLDCEGSPRTLAERLVELGVDPDLVDEHLRYIRPSGHDLVAVANVVLAMEPALVIVDGFAALLASLGLDEDKAMEALQPLRRLCRPLADAGAAVVVVDHVVKAKDQQGRWGRGSGAKLGEADMAFGLAVVDPFARGKDGMAKLTVAKDRWGSVGAQGDVAAEVVYETTEEGRLRITLRPATDSGPWEGPSDCMTAVLELLKARAPAELSGQALIDGLAAIGKKGFRPSTVREAAERLVLQVGSGVVGRSGARRSRLFLFDPNMASFDDLEPF